MRPPTGCGFRGRRGRDGGGFGGGGRFSGGDGRGGGRFGSRAGPWAKPRKQWLPAALL